MIDAVRLCQDLLRVPSVTGAGSNGCMTILERILGDAGFQVERLYFDDRGTYGVDNLFAQIGSGSPHLCFAGHTDVVPPGDGWQVDPFSGEIIDNQLYGRGAVDMKSGVAAFVSAAADFLAHDRSFDGTISLLITEDEEKEAVNGTVRVLDWMKTQGISPDACLVGEPTSSRQVGDAIKVGRRGSLSATITVPGTQGHVAYPAQADNPVPRLLSILHALQKRRLDDGYEQFEASNLEVVGLHVDNTSRNVIPPKAGATLNIRFNPSHTNAELRQWIEHEVRAVDQSATIEFFGTGDAFLNPNDALTAHLSAAVESVTGCWPTLSTGGGTSDARFIKDHCPTIEFGVRNEFAHKIDECVAVEDVNILHRIYASFLRNYFSRTS